MSGMRNPVGDDLYGLVEADRPVAIGYRLRKCGTTRLVIIAVVLLLIVIGAIVAVVAIMLTRSKGTNTDQWFIRSCYFKTLK